MRILVLTPHYPPKAGGTADYVFRFVRELTNAGYVVKVITKDGDASSSPVEVERFGQPWTPLALSRIIGIIREFRADVVLLQYGPYAFNRWGPGIPVVSLVISACLLTKTRFSVYGHELYQDWRHSILRTPWHMMQRIAVFMMLIICKKFVVTLKSRKDRIVRWLPQFAEKIEVVPITPTLDTEITEPGWREAKGIPSTTFLLSAMGTDDPQKGAKAFGQIAESISEHGIDFKFVVIGGLKTNHPLIEDWGYVSPHDAWNLLVNSDLFVLPYEDGVSGRRTSAVNALAAGTAMLTTCGPNTDLRLFPSGSVATVPTKDFGQISVEAVKILTDGRRRLTLAESARKASRNFEWPSHMGKWITLLGND